MRLAPIKMHGGVTVVQDPSEALFAAMPQSALTTTHGRLHSLREIANQNWLTALQTYRTALDHYCRVLSMRSGNNGQLMYTRNGRPPDHSPLLPIEPLALPIPLQPRSLDVLSPREQEVVQLIARGYSNQQIADALVLTRGTVANHVAHILDKVGASNRAQVVALVLQATPADQAAAR